MSGRTVVTRLLFIAKTSPTLAPAAYNLAIQQLLQSRDVSTYSSTVSAYNALPSVTSKIVPNRKWIEETTSRNTSERERLEVELKTYTSNMIKESVRVRQSCLDIVRITGLTLYQDGPS